MYMKKRPQCVSPIWCLQWGLCQYTKPNHAASVHHLPRSLDQNLVARSQPQRHGSRPGGPGANHWGLVGPSLASAEHAPWVSSGCFRTFPERTPSWSHDLKPKGLRIFFFYAVCPYALVVKIHGFLAHVDPFFWGSMDLWLDFLDHAPLRDELDRRLVFSYEKQPLCHCPRLVPNVWNGRLGWLLLVISSDI